MEPSQRGWRDGWRAESSVKGTEVAEVQTAGAQHTWKAQVVEGGQGSWGVPGGPGQRELRLKMRAGIGTLC